MYINVFLLFLFAVFSVFFMYKHRQFMLEMKLCLAAIDKATPIIEKELKEMEERLLIKYCGEPGSVRRKQMDEYFRQVPGRTVMAWILFMMHDHDRETEAIVYSEANVVELLEFLGYPVKFADYDMEL